MAGVTGSGRRLQEWGVGSGRGLQEWGMAGSGEWQGVGSGRRLQEWGVAGDSRSGGVDSLIESIHKLRNVLGISPQAAP